jgi:hypothetical protein
LLAAAAILEKVTVPGRHQRIRELVAPHAPALRQRSGRPAASGLAPLTHEIDIVDAKLLAAAPRREISSFAGLAMLTRGPVYQCRGNVKVLDEVPLECTLVVEDGSCLVNGHLHGNVAATVEVEVRGNLSGVVIVARGGIYVGACLNRSTAVSKLGRTLARRCEDPKLVFAGEQITILGDARGGTYMAPTIEISGVASGGSFHVSRLLKASRFAALAGRGPVIEMQRRVACDRVGKLMEEGASRLMSRLAAVRRRLHNVDALIGLAEHECEHYANNALVYLIGGEEKREKLEELNRAERRLAFLDRIIAGIEVLSEAAEDQLAQGNHSDGADDAWREMDRELADHLSENADDRDLAAERDDLANLSRNLSAPAGLASNVLGRLREKRLSRLLERKELLRTIEDLENAIRQPEEGQDPYDRFLGKTSRLDVLTRVLQKTRARPQGDRLHDRAQSAFLQVLLKTIDTRRRRIKGYHATRERHQAEYDALSEQLFRRYHMNSPEIASDEDVLPTVTGYFEEGARLCTEICFLDEPEPPTASVLAPAGEVGERTYRRENDRIVEAAAD